MFHKRHYSNVIPIFLWGTWDYGIYILNLVSKPLNLKTMEWYLKVLRNYAGFEGRARRTEFWVFLLFNLIFSALIMLLDRIMWTYSFIGGLYSLFVLIPTLAVTFRRLHDINKSGFYILLFLIPVIGQIWLLILFLKEGDAGDNQYGSDPKAVQSV